MLYILKPVTGIRLSGCLFVRKDSQIPNISGPLSFESSMRISSILGKICLALGLDICNP